MEHNDIPLSPRLVLLHRQAHEEEGLAEDQIPEPNAERRVALFPRSFVDRLVGPLPPRQYDFNFRGAYYIDRKTIKARRWIFDFAAKHFTNFSHFQITDRRIRWFGLMKRHKPLGDFDRTYADTGCVPKEMPRDKRGFFDDAYFNIMHKSEFTLCPPGDTPWSVRFYEAILSRSIPILSSDQHAGRNELEYDIGYRYYRLGDTYQWRPDWAEENFEKFLTHQTLIERGTHHKQAQAEPTPRG